jgi:outer membrane translocation and assembly module TamA
LLILNEELRVPVWGGLRAALFADVGQVWPSWGEADWGFAVGAGIGIRWATPIGPVWADVAWPVVNPDIDPPGEPPYLYPIRPMSSSKPKFYVGIGRPF